MKSHPDLGYNILWSAASYLLRDGQQLRDSAVLTEARSRKAKLDRAFASHQQPRPTSTVDQIAEQAK